MAMVTVFLVAWTPYAMSSLYVMIQKTAPIWVHVLPTMFAKSCTLLNPIICAVISSKFRQAASALILRRNTVVPHIPSNEEGSGCGVELTPR